MNATMKWDDEIGFWSVVDEHGDVWEVVANGSATFGRGAAACERDGECRVFVGELNSAEGGGLQRPVQEGDSTAFTDDDGTEYEVVGQHWTAREEA